MTLLRPKLLTACPIRGAILPPSMMHRLSTDRLVFSLTVPTLRVPVSRWFIVVVFAVFIGPLLTLL